MLAITVLFLTLMIKNMNSLKVIDTRVSHPLGLDLGGRVTLSCKSNEK